MYEFCFVFDYMFHVMMSGNVKVTKVNDWCSPAWRFELNDSVIYIFEEYEVHTIKNYFDRRKECMCLERVEEYERFFSLCV